MKKRKLISLLAAIFVAVGITSVSVARHFWRGETMKVSKVEEKWGNAPFSAELFKSGNIKRRASMAASLIQQQKIYKGVDRAEIRKALGDFDGFYFSDMFPTYMIQKGESHAEESWQIVFLLDRNEKVSEIIIHKNCCDESVR